MSRSGAAGTPWLHSAPLAHHFPLLPRPDEEPLLRLLELLELLKELRLLLLEELRLAGVFRGIVRVYELR